MSRVKPGRHILGGIQGRLAVDDDVREDFHLCRREADGIDSRRVLKSLFSRRQQSFWQLENNPIFGRTLLGFMTGVIDAWKVPTIRAPKKV